MFFKRIMYDVRFFKLNETLHFALKLEKNEVNTIKAQNKPDSQNS